MTVLQQLELLRQQHAFSDLDLHFARLMARLAGKESPELVLGACLVSQHIGNGHICLNLHSQAGRQLFEPENAAESIQTPELTSWLTALRASPVVGQPGEYRPLILDDKSRLYLYRYWHYERQLAEDLLVRARIEFEDVDAARLEAGLVRLFPRGEESGINWQKIAAAAAVLKGLCVISGGPGTGKTTTVVRILALLAEQAGERPPRIGLAAPTGKAAARLQEAIRLAKQSLPLDIALKEKIPEDASTLHRLLGARGDSVYFRHNRDNPLPLDVLVVDEASMVDLALMAKLTQALLPQARLILLGDKDQLASVEAGSVLGDICGKVPGFSAAFSERLQTLAGDALPAGHGVASPLADCVVLLQRSYRFGAESGIGNLAARVNRGQGGEALALLQSGRFQDISWRPLASVGELRQHLSQAVTEGFRPYLEAIRGKLDSDAVFAAFNRFRVLCAHRRGPFGVEELNRLIQTHLESARLIDARHIWYAGRPVMITRNDYNLKLFNGDIGIALPDPDADARLRVFFQSADGSLRRFPPSRLPAHETVYAMTVHKSQGSEFDRLLLLLPLETSQAVSRELVYTGLTRARQAVDIWGDAQVLEAAVARVLRRSSGLRDALWGGAAKP